MKYVSVCKALYDYKAQSDEELTFNEDNILYILDKDDDPDWWKAQLKAASLDQVGPIGLVPANYIDEAEPIGKVEALYDYSALQDEELSFKEGDIMVLYENDDPDWFIVKGKDGSIGLVPSNYVEEVNNKTVAAAPEPAIPEAPQASVSVFSAISNSPLEKARGVDEAASWSVHEYDTEKKKKKKSKGNLLIGNGMLCYGSETDKASPVRQFSIGEVGHSVQDGKNIHIEISDAASTVFDFQASSKSEAKAVVAKIEESKSLAPAQQPPSPAQQPIQQPIQPPAPVAPEPAEPTCEPRWAIVLYDFAAGGTDEISVKENDQVLATDYVSSDAWWTIEYQDGRSGIVPATYVQFQEEFEADLERDHALQQQQKEAEAARQQRECEAEAARQRRVAEEEETRRRQEQEERARREEARRVEEAKRVESPRRSQIPAPPPPNKPPAGRAMPTTQEVQSIPTPNNRSLPDRPKQAQDPGKPNPAKVRTWTDRSGAFKVEAQFLNCHNDKIRLHKINGVKIDVPVQKMCMDDLRYIEQETGQRLFDESSDDIPLAHFASKDGRKQFDWFEYFMKANVPMNNSLRYASTFQAEGLGQKDLENLTHRKMKSLGMSESHVQRLQRFIETNDPEPASDEEAMAVHKKKGKKSVSFGATSVIDDSEDESWPQPHNARSQIDDDARLARQLQEQYNSQQPPQEESPVFNRGGHLHRRGTGRPAPNNAAPRGVNTAMMDKIKTQLSSTPLQPTPVQVKPSPPATPPRDPVPQSAPPPVNNVTPSTGFSDDAWAPRAVSSPSNPPAQAQTGDALAQTKAAWSAPPPPPPPSQPQTQPQPIQTPPPIQPSQPPVPLPPRQRPTPATPQSKVDPQMLSQWTHPAGTPQQVPPPPQQPVQQPVQQPPQQPSHVQQMTMQFGTQQQAAPPPPPRSPMTQFVPQATPPPAQPQFMQAPTQNPAFAAHSPVQQHQFIPQQQQMVQQPMMQPQQQMIQPPHIMQPPAMTVPVNAALQQPLVPMATGMSSQSSQSSEGRTWANATPDNPFGGGSPAQRPLQQQGSFSMGSSSSSLQPSQVFASMTGQAGFQQQQPTGFNQPMQNHDPNDKYSVFKSMNGANPSVFSQGQPQPGAFQQPQQTGFGQMQQPAFGQNAFGQPQQQHQPFYNRW